jgi:hypothetical protein
MMIVFVHFPQQTADSEDRPGQSENSFQNYQLEARRGICLPLGIPASKEPDLLEPH